LQHLLRLLYEWDVFEAIATVTQHYDWCFPQYDDSPEPFVRAAGLFPPLLTGTVSNDFNLGKGPNLCFITGANRAGKTTFLKSFGLAVYLAHVGFPVPARSFRTTVFNGLLITIDLCDGMGQGYSHFYSEVRRLKDILGQIREKKRVLVIFDDLFLGTQVKETGGEVLQVIEGLAGIEGTSFSFRRLSWKSPTACRGIGISLSPVSNRKRRAGCPGTATGSGKAFPGSEPERRCCGR